jgi:RNA polymerase sigma-70 factor (ECF subfamily)
VRQLTGVPQPPQESEAPPPNAPPAPRADDDTASAESWSQALARHGRWLRRVLLNRLGEPQAVEDVLQDVSLAAAAAQTGPPSALPSVATAPAWLYRVAVRQALLYRRRAGRRRRLLDRIAGRSAGATRPLPAASASSREAGPLGWLLIAERDALVRAALQQLPPRDAEMLLLKYAEHWSYHDLAERLGMTHAAVESRLHRARRRLREELARLAVDREDVP